MWDSNASCSDGIGEPTILHADFCLLGRLCEPRRGNCFLLKQLSALVELKVRIDLVVGPRREMLPGKSNDTYPNYKFSRFVPLHNRLDRGRPQVQEDSAAPAPLVLPASRKGFLSSPMEAIAFSHLPVISNLLRSKFLKLVKAEQKVCFGASRATLKLDECHA